MKYFIYILVFLMLWSCSTTKNIPEGKYLLNDFSVKTDNKKVDNTILEDYVRQKPNSSFLFSGFKPRLMIYNTVSDTTKGINRFIQNKLGQAPVIYSPQLAKTSANQIQKQLSNQGYLRAEVDTIQKIKDKKMSLTYDVKTGQVYKIRNYEYTLSDSAIASILNPIRKYTSIKKDMIFDQEALDEVIDRRNMILRNLGYYKFAKENLYHKADTTVGDHQVDLFLSLRKLPDSTGFYRYKFRNVTIVSGFDPVDDDNQENFSNPDTVSRQGITIVHGKNNFLRNSMLLRNNYIRPGRYYSDRAVNGTYTAFNGTGAVNQTNIELTPVTVDSLHFVDAKITLSPGNVHWFETAIDGTNSAGDLGVAPSIAYRHQNIFNGAEVLSIKLKGAYEFVSGDKDASIAEKNYYEYGIETSLSFPQFLFPWLRKNWREIPSASTQITLGLTNQHRAEYTRQFFNATYTFRWSTKRNQIKHALDLMDINYVRMPWKSHDFDSLLRKNKVLATSYDDMLIARTGYNITYTIGKGRRFPRTTYTIRGGLDVSGWLPRLVQTTGALNKNSNGQYQIAGIAFAEYVKVDLSFSQTRLFDRQKSFAYRIALGVANPFGNSDVLPYERRYFSGGANSVRGWNTRKLGPGSYQTNDSTTFVNQVGDIKLDLNVEYRNKISDLIELAGFIDAGNVWTIKNYLGQEGGLFKFDKFYKEIAVSYGVGLRLDLSFLLLRLDYGIKAYDPSRETAKFRLLKPRIYDTAWHFGIGYPF